MRPCDLTGTDHLTCSGLSCAPRAQAVLDEVRPARVALQRRRIADDNERHARAREADVDAPLVLDEPDGAALARAHRGEDCDVFLAPLQMATQLCDLGIVCCRATACLPCGIVRVSHAWRSCVH